MEPTATLIANVKEDHISYSSEDTKDDSGDFKHRIYSKCKPQYKNDMILRSSKILLSSDSPCYEEQMKGASYFYSGLEKCKSSEIRKIKPLRLSNASYFFEKKKERLRYSCTEEKNFIKEVKANSKDLYYPLVQEIKGPLYFSKNKKGAIYVAKIRKVQSKINRSIFDKGLKFTYRVPKDVPEIKFWNQRFYYYSKFDEGIKMDYESWYSVTPEDLAYYISLIAGPHSVCIDPFAGSGGNIIQFSKNCSKVYAVDIDPVKIDIMKNNSMIYKCPDNIEFILHDCLKLDSTDIKVSITKVILIILLISNRQIMFFSLLHGVDLNTRTQEITHLRRWLLQIYMK